MTQLVTVSKGRPVGLNFLSVVPVDVTRRLVRCCDLLRFYSPGQAVPRVVMLPFIDPFRALVAEATLRTLLITRKVSLTCRVQLCRPRIRLLEVLVRTVLEAMETLSRVVAPRPRTQARALRAALGPFLSVKLITRLFIRFLLLMVPFSFVTICSICLGAVFRAVAVIRLKVQASRVLLVKTVILLLQIPRPAR